MLTDNRKQQTQNDYAKISNLYDLDFGRDRDHFDLIERSIEIVKENSLIDFPFIDLGCGSGVVTDYLIEKGIRNIEAVDLTQEFCKMVSQKHNGKVQVFQDDMVNFIGNKPNNSVAAIIASFSIIHIPDEEVDMLFKGIQKCLKPGGIFLMSCHKGTYKGMEKEPYQTQNDQRLDIKEELTCYMNYFTEDELKRRLTLNGLSLVDIQTFEPKPVPGEFPVPKIWLIANKI